MKKLSKTNIFDDIIIFQGQYASAPSTLTRGHPSCTMCRTTSTENCGGNGAGTGSTVRSRFASVGTSTRIDSLQHVQAASSASSSHQAPHPKKKSTASMASAAGLEVNKGRPLQHVEKTCSFVMAALFLLFNALYWPWLLRDQDFDYAKFSATHQEQLKL